ncbi:hypothetical protein AB0F45_36840 [Streptomyces achromogenes]|uniref:hypothetical protein n=1 Tax=Streptomyces achromogenes TaxID=67255 RepID=UPI0033F0567B
MEAEILALAGMGASSLVTLALQDLWGWGRRRFAPLLGRGTPAAEGAAEAELERTRQELLDARRAGDEDTADAVEEAWAQRLRDLLVSHPEAGHRLREVVAATIERSPAPVALGHILHYVNNVPVFQAMNDHWARCAEEHATTAMFLCGLPGVGKRTTLRRWLQSHRDDLPGELLQADLARDERGRPADPVAVLERWLAQLGVAREDRPADADAKAALVRQRLRTRPAVLILENVSRPGAVRPLLPDSAGHIVLMTGQRVPLGLDTLLDFEPVEIAPPGRRVHRAGPARRRRADTAGGPRAVPAAGGRAGHRAQHRQDLAAVRTGPAGLRPARGGAAGAGRGRRRHREGRLRVLPRGGAPAAGRRAPAAGGRAAGDRRLGRRRHAVRTGPQPARGGGPAPPRRQPRALSGR